MTEVRRSNPTATVIDTRPGEVRVRLDDNAELPRWYPSVLQTTVVGTEGVMLRVNQEDMVFVPYARGVDISHQHHLAYYSADGVISSTVDRIPVQRLLASGRYYPYVLAAGAYDDFGIEGKVSRSDHTHDSRYYSQAEVNALMQAWRTRTDGGYSGSFALFDSAGTTPFGPEAVFTGLDPSGTYTLVSTAGWRVTSTTGQGGAGFWLTHAGAPTGEYVAWHSTITCNGMSNHPVSFTTTYTCTPLPSGEIRARAAFSWTSGSIYVNTSRIVSTLTRIS